MCAAITTGALSLGMSAFQMYQGNKSKKEAERALNNYERQELDNAFKEIEISTLGADLLREENARTSAGLIDAARQGGSRSIIGAVPKVVGASNQINKEAAKLIDDQFINREYAIAGDNTRIEGITENRDNNNINALSSQIQAGKQDFWSGAMGAATSLAYLGRNIPQGSSERPQIEGVESPETAGMQPSNSQPLPSAPLLFGSTPYSMPKASSYDDPMFGYDYMKDVNNKYPRF